MSRRAPVRRRLTRAERREQLLDAATELVVDGGLGAVTMEGVAERAGVSGALPYSYFDNASDVLVALFERENEALDARVAEATVGATDFEGLVRGTLEAWLDAVDERGMLMGALLVEHTSGPLEMRRRERLVGTRSLFAAIIRDEFGLSQATATVGATVLLAGSLGVLDMWQNREAERDVLVKTFVTMAHNAVASLNDEG